MAQVLFSAALSIHIGFLGSFKVLVGTGTPPNTYNGADFFEVIDLSDPTLVCDPFPSLPIPGTACTAGLQGGTTPLVCAASTCFLYQSGNWNSGS